MFTPFVRDLQKGDTGYDVQVMQRMLNALGYNCGTPDGSFGTNTENALKSWANR